MPEKRSIGKCIVLSILTCGIYWIFWAIKLGKEVVQVKDKNDQGTLEIVLMLFLPFIGMYLAEKKLYEGCRNQNYTPKEDRSIIYLVLGLFGLSLVSMGLMQDDMNKYVDALSAGFVPTAGAAVNGAAVPGVPSVGVNKPTQDQIVKELQMHKELFDQGVLTEEEFNTKKQQLLAMM